MPTDITPFLRPAVPKTDSDLEKDLEISKDLVDKMVPSYLKDLYRDPFNQSLTLSDEELDDIREACLSDSTRIINYLDSVLKETGSYGSSGKIFGTYCRTSLCSSYLGRSLV